MLCNEYRDLMFERISGELTAEQTAACSGHEQTCVVCRAEVADVKWMSTRMRAGWPAEEPLPLQINLPQPASRVFGARNWFDLGSLWFSRASATLALACLVAFVVLRPSVELGGGALRVAFRGTSSVQAASLTPEQVQALVNTQVQAALANQANVKVESSRPATVQLASDSRSAADTASVQVAMQVRELQRREAALSQQVQQHGLYLESLWRNGAGAVQPANLVR